MAGESDTPFADIVKQGKTLGLKAGQREAMDWFRKQALAVTNVNQKAMIETKAPFKRLVSLSETSVGKMYMFVYDPKHKATLPYYDTYPLVFPIDYQPDSMLGLNMHYLPPVARAKFMDALYALANNQKYDKTTRLQLSYRILSESARYNKFVGQCIKRYLFSHVRSTFLYISPDEWEVALMLPTQNFVQTVGEYERNVTTSTIYKNFTKANF